MNKNIVLAVAKRDLRSWFTSPANYVFVVLFAAASCAFLVLSPAFFLNNLANLDTLNAAFPVVAGVFVSLATMGMWSSERSHGTQELLFTLPATDFELQLGKFVAYVAIYTASLAFTLVLPLVLTWLGNPDLGQLFANYVGFWLLGVMLVAVTTIGSQLTNSATIAALLSLLLCAVVLGLSYLLEFFGADVDFHAQQGSAHGFAQVVQAQVARAAALQGVVQHKFQGQNVRQCPAVHLPRKPRFKVRLHFGSGDLTLQNAVSRFVPGEQAKVHPVGFVAAAGVGQLNQWYVECGIHACTSSISTCALTRCRSMSVGQMPSNSLLLFMP